MATFFKAARKLLQARVELLENVGTWSDEETLMYAKDVLGMAEYEGVMEEHRTSGIIGGDFSLCPFWELFIGANAISARLGTAAIDDWKSLPARCYGYHQSFASSSLAWFETKRSCFATSEASRRLW